MDVSTVIEIISTLGFPIALSIAMGWMFFKIFTWQREDAKEREIRDNEQIKHFSVIISDNSKALLKNSETMELIAKKLEDVDEKIDEIKQDVAEIKYKQNK